MSEDYKQRQKENKARLAAAKQGTMLHVASEVRIKDIEAKSHEYRAALRAGMSEERINALGIVKHTTVKLPVPVMRDGTRVVGANAQKRNIKRIISNLMRAGMTRSAAERYIAKMKKEQSASTRGAQVFAGE